ncbi:MAG: DUF1127 domain-containing protein [Pseudomonadota bacterium]
MALYEIVTPKPAFGFAALAESLAALKIRFAERRALAREARALKAMSDHDLMDLGLGRSEIDYAVRYGR